MQILLIHADPVFAAGLGDTLEHMGCTIDYAATGRIGVRLATNGAFDAIVLAAELPSKGGGLQVCRTLRETGTPTPVMVLGSQTGVEPTVAALQAGADDYQPQPAAVVEVHARLRALSRRRKTGMLQIGDLRFDPAAERVYRRGERLHPTSMGLTLLRVLIEATPGWVTHAKLEACLWGQSHRPICEASLRVQIHALRAVVDKPFDQPLILTCRGVGYRMAVPRAQQHVSGAGRKRRPA